MCILPFGTGNDLSKVLGFGSTPKQDWSKNLKGFAEMIVNAHDEKFNVWDITWHLRESGDVFQWDTGSKSK
jgi:diacylglycerol kinase family enzyme